jgi:hypothetical protein
MMHLQIASDVLSWQCVMMLLQLHVNMQNQWKHTALQKAVADFHDCFLDGLLASNRDELARKARKAVSQPTTRW